MSTFLQLVNQTMQEAGIAGSPLVTLQSGLSAESTRFAGWVNREWQRIQADKDQWQWLRTSGNFTTTAAQNQYTPAQVGAICTPTTFTAAQFANWKRDSFRFWLASGYGDEQLAAFLNWDQFRNLYLYAQNRVTQSRPVCFTVDPQKNLWLGLVPDQTYNVVFEYYAAPAALVADTDTPAMPQQYHDLIVFKALKAYGVFMAAPEVIGRASEEISRIFSKLCVDQLPIIFSGPPLA